MAVRSRPRSPQLRLALRGFCLGAFVFLGRALEEGDELPFAFEEHGQRAGPALYQYRPLVQDFVESHAAALAERDDARLALDALLREPAAAIYASAHAGLQPTEDQALLRTVLIPLLVSTAEACGGFDWDDEAFERGYAELERSLYGASRTYAAVAPLVGLSVVTQVELGERLRIRPVSAGELARHWPEAQSLVPAGFGAEVDRYCVLELQRGLELGQEPPDAPAELADAVSALRLATAAPVGTGPVVFERLDWRPFGVRTSLAIAAAQPAGEPTRLDSFRADLVRELLARLSLADDDAALADALDRWEISLFQLGRVRSEQLRGVLVGLFGDAFELRVAVLLGRDADERRRLHESLHGLGSAGGDRVAAEADVVRRALLATLRHGERRRLVRELDALLLDAGAGAGGGASGERRAAALTA